MATVTSPIILDSTGQDIVTKLNAISTNLNKTASDIPYDANTTIKGKIDTMANSLPYYVDVTVTTNADGYANLSSYALVDKTISAQVISPQRSACDLWLNLVGDSGYRAFVYARGTGTAIASTECIIRIWLLP